MSVARDLSTPTPSSRFEGGFDRWDADARDGHAILWRGSERARHVLGNGSSVWMWDQQVRSWKRLPPEQEGQALRDHSHALNRLRRALLTARSLESPLETERTAARRALQRIGTAIIHEWKASNPAGNGAWSPGWLDHPAAIYVAATRHCRMHFPETQQLSFDPKLFATLLAETQKEYEENRRPNPPRLRPEDMVLLQTNARSVEVEQPADENDFIEKLREDLPSAILREDQSAMVRKRCCKAVMLGLAFLALSAVVVTSYVHMS